MPIDPSIPLGIQTQKTGLEALQAPLQTAQGLLALRQNTMRLNANQAISDAYAQSVNPDGSVDFNKLQSLASQNGAGAFLPEFMGQIAQQRNSQLQYDTGKLELALKQQGDIRNRIGSLALDPNLGKSDMSSSIVTQISEAAQNGTLPMDQAIREIKSIPSDPGAQAGWVRQHLMNSLSGEAKIQALMPKLSVLNTGGQQQLIAQNPMTGAPQVMGTVNNTLTPGEATQEVQGVTPEGTPYAVTKQQWLNGAGTSGTGGGYTGRFDQSGGAGGMPAGAMQKGLSPGQQSALVAQAGTSNTAAQTLHDAASDAPMRINLLNQARDALSGIQTGPGTDWRNQAKSFFNALAPDTAKAIGFTGDVKDYDEFKKILTNYASSVSGSIGNGTDARLNAAVTGNANPGISKMANEDILAKTIAAEKMRAAQDYAFQNSGLTSDKFNQWQSQWNRSVNPDAFVFTSMSPQQQQAFVKRQSPQQLQKFKSDLGNLVRAGVIQMPGQ